MPTPELKIGVYFTVLELKTVIGLLEKEEEQAFTEKKHSEAEVYDTLANQLQDILSKTLEDEPKKKKKKDHAAYQKEPANPKKEYMEKISPAYVNSDTPQLDKIGPPRPINITDRMETEYPETMKGFKLIVDDEYNLFAMKQADYGPGNISMNGNKELALVGLGVRMNDKTQRILNLTYENKEPNNESLIDSFRDISIYGVIAQLVMENKWGK